MAKMLENLFDHIFVLNIKGRIGENIMRVEKLENQRHQKTKSGKNFSSEFIYFFL